MPRSPLPDQKRPLRGIGLVVAGVIALLACYGLWQAWTANAALNDARKYAIAVQQSIEAGDVPSAEDNLARLQDATSTAYNRTNGALWGLAGATPFVGDDIRAVRAIALTANEISHYGLPPLVNAAQAIGADQFTPRNSRVDIDAIIAIEPALTDAAVIFTEARARLEEIDTNRLLGPLETRLSPIRDLVIDTSDAVNVAAQAAQLMPEMLGANETRHWLLVSQNNAEIRSTGGLPGAWTLIRARNGHVEIIDQGSGNDISPFDNATSISISDEEEKLFTPRIRRDFRNANLIPHFPRAAELISEMSRVTMGQQIDGVVAVDPVALSYVLEGTGPITMPDGVDLSSANVVDELLHNVYLRIDNAADQDFYFQDAAQIAFDTVASGQGDPFLVLNGLVRGSREGRILVWSERAAEQRILDLTPVSGAISAHEGSSPQIGVYLNDGTTGKLQYFLRYDTQFDAVRCFDEDRQQFVWTTTFTSMVPTNHNFPFWIVGDQFGNRPAGSQAVVLRIYAPLGGSIDELRLDGNIVATIEQSHLGRDVRHLGLWLEPGQSVTIQGVASSGPAQPGDIEIVSTPSIEPGPHIVTAESAC